jgi:hypothetical protein
VRRRSTSEHLAASGSRRLIEVGRRLALVSATVAAVGLAYWTGFEPYLLVAPATPEQLAEVLGQGDLTPRTASSLLATRPARDRGQVLQVSGPAWAALFAGVRQSFAQNLPIPGWEHRLQRHQLAEARTDNARRGRMTDWDRAEEVDRVQRLKAQYGIDVTFRGSFSSLYFLAREAPFADAAGSFDRRDTFLIQQTGEPGLTLAVSALPAYQLHGFSDVVTLPERFAYPYRPAALWVALAGLVLYLGLPWGRIPANVVAFQRWRVMLADLAAGLLLCALFVVAPFAIIGGTREALTTFLPFTLVFWAIACLGLTGLYWTAWSAVYRVSVLPKGLQIDSLAGALAFDYTAIMHVQPIRLRPPKWLIVLGWLSALSNRSTAQVAGSVGRALLLEMSASNGLRLDLQGGGRVFLWYSDQLGTTAVQHFAVLGQALRQPGIPWASDVIEMRTVIPPSV